MTQKTQPLAKCFLLWNFFWECCKCVFEWFPWRLLSSDWWYDIYFACFGKAILWAFQQYIVFLVYSLHNSCNNNTQKVLIDTCIDWNYMSYMVYRKKFYDVLRGLSTHLVITKAFLMQGLMIRDADTGQGASTCAARCALYSLMFRQSAVGSRWRMSRTSLRSAPGFTIITVSPKWSSPSVVTDRSTYGKVKIAMTLY